MSLAPSVVSLGDHVAAYVQPPGGWFLNNAGWIDGRDRSLLVDTCATERRTEMLLAAAREACGRTPSTVVLTHSHGDHAHGAALLAEAQATVVATEPAARSVASGPHTYPEVFTCEHWGRITPPESITSISEVTSIDLGAREVEIHPVPFTAHTDGDLVVWSPEDRALFTGDLLFHGVTPLALHGSIVGWCDALRWVSTFDAEHIVPGHGPVIGGDCGFDATLDYLSWLIDVVSASDDLDESEAQARKRWPSWQDAERHAVNLRIAHGEVHGHELDWPAALEAMLRSAGGRIAVPPDPE